MVVLTVPRESSSKVAAKSFFCNSRRPCAAIAPFLDWNNNVFFHPRARKWVNSMFPTSTLISWIRRLMTRTFPTHVTHHFRLLRKARRTGSPGTNRSPCPWSPTDSPSPSTMRSSTCLVRPGRPGRCRHQVIVSATPFFTLLRELGHTTHSTTTDSD